MSLQVLNPIAIRSRSFLLHRHHRLFSLLPLSSCHNRYYHYNNLYHHHHRNNHNHHQKHSNFNNFNHSKSISHNLYNDDENKHCFYYNQQKQSFPFQPQNIFNTNFNLNIKTPSSASSSSLPSINRHNLYHHHNLLHSHRRCFTTPPPTIKKETKSSSSSYLKYINPVFIISKISSLLYNICYYTLDSIIHPSKGKERLSNIWAKIKKEAKHLRDGFKLMWLDIKTATSILWKFAKGKELTYRERRQLRRVSLDVLRIFPMLVIILIPFLEAALPIILWLFPNMLPSRFQHEHLKVERRKKLFQARIGLASFFEDTLHEFIKQTKKKKEFADSKGINRLDQILEKIKKKEEISNQHILKVASLFDDEMALDNAQHHILANMCRYMQLNTFGTATMLRTRLYSKIRDIRKEDQEIRKEGLDNVPEQLLKQLLRERGMRADFQEWVLRANLSKWLELSLDHDVPVTLLIMSRIFTLQHIPGQNTTDMLKDTISNIGDATTKEMLVERGGITNTEIEKEVIQRQQQLIKEEQEEGEKDENIEKKKEQKKRLRELADTVETLASDSIIDPEKQEILEIKEKLQDIEDEEDVIFEELKKKKEETEALKEREEILLKEKEKEMEDILFDEKEDMIRFGIEEIDEEEEAEEIEYRLKTRNKLSSSINKILEKTSAKMENVETNLKFKNTLQRFNDNMDDITEDELKNALKDTLNQSKNYTDDEIEQFLDELDEIKEKKPTIQKLSKRIEKLIDDYEEDIDIKDIKPKKDDDDNDDNKEI